MITSQSLKEAIAEARRFIVKAESAERTVSKTGYIYPSKEIAAAKRASMDLTRSLADLRRRWS